MNQDNSDGEGEEWRTGKERKKTKRKRRTNALTVILDGSSVSFFSVLSLVWDFEYFIFLSDFHW